MKTKTLTSMFAVGALTAAPALAATTTVTPTNLDNVNKGSSVVQSTTDSFLTSPNGSGNIGALINDVFLNNGIYTYTHTVVPGVDNVSEFNSGQAIFGFNGVAGYSFSDTTSAGGNGDASDFNIDHEGDGTLDFETAFGTGSANESGYDRNESITFFFQSTNAPTTGTYNIINHEPGTANSYTPAPGTPSVPTPTALPAGLLALGGLAMRRRKARKALA